MSSSALALVPAPLVGAHEASLQFLPGESTTSVGAFLPRVLCSAVREYGVARYKVAIELRVDRKTFFRWLSGRSEFSLNDIMRHPTLGPIFARKLYEAFCGGFSG